MTDHTTDSTNGFAPPRPGGRGPIFLVGSMRSGSTMLRLILDSHPAIAIPAETGFMAGLAAAKEIPQWKFGRGWYERLGWTESELDQRLRDFYSGMFERHARQQGKPRWGEKTPFHTDYVAEMAQVFPEAVFVGIVRHPGAVASSLRTRFHYQFQEALGYWESTNLKMAGAGSRLGDRFTLLRYEDLVVRGEPVLRELVSFLQEPWSDEVLHHHQVQPAKGAPRAVEGSTVTSDPIDARRAGQWAAAVDADDREALRSVADAAKLFGYDAMDHEVSTPLVSAASGSRTALAKGDDLARLRREWEGRLDFDPPRRLAAVEADPQELAARLARTEQALVRARSRRAVVVADALRKVQHGRSLSDVRAAWSAVQGKRGRNDVAGEGPAT